MTRDIKNHAVDYMILGLWLMAGLWGLIWYRSEMVMQLKLLFLILSGYVIWGTVHHYRNRDLSSKIVLEYGLIATLAMIIVWAVMSVA